MTFVARAAAASRGVPLAEFGPLGSFVGDPDATDVFLNGDGSVWVDRGRGAELQVGVRVGAGAARELGVRLVGLGGHAAVRLDWSLGRPRNPKSGERYRPVHAGLDAGIQPIYLGR